MWEIVMAMLFVNWHKEIQLHSKVKFIHSIKTKYIYKFSFFCSYIALFLLASPRFIRGSPPPRVSGAGSIASHAKVITFHLNTNKKKRNLKSFFICVGWLHRRRDEQLLNVQLNCTCVMLNTRHCCRRCARFWNFTLQYRSPK